jgi:hypothetical protein
VKPNIAFILAGDVGYSEFWDYAKTAQEPNLEAQLPFVGSISTNLGLEYFYAYDCQQ